MAKNKQTKQEAEKQAKKPLQFVTQIPESLTKDAKELVYDTHYDEYYVYPHEYDTVQNYIDIYNTDGKIKKAIDLPVEKALNNIADYTHSNPKITTWVKENILNDVKYKRWLFDIMSARYTGVSVSLVVPEYYDGKLLIDEIYTIHPMFYVPDSGISEKKIKFNANGLFNKEIPRKQLIVYAHDPQFTDPYGTSLIAAIQKDYEEKKIAEYAYRIFLRRYGLPGIVVQVPEDTDKTDMTEIASHITKMQAGGNMISPSMVDNNGKFEPNMKLDIVEIAKGSTDFANFVKTKDRDIMTGLGVPSILFNTDESGSYSLGAIHKEMFNLTIQRCQNAIQSVFCNQILQPLIQANFGVEEHGQLIFQDVEGRAFKELSQSDAVLINAGVLSNMIPSQLRTQYEILGIKATDAEIAEVCKYNKQKWDMELENAKVQEKNQNITGAQNAQSARFPHGQQLKGKTGGMRPEGE